MTYRNKFNYLKGIFNLHSDIIKAQNGIDIYNLKFVSKNYNLLPGKENYFCSKHNINFNEHLNNEEHNAFIAYPNFLKHHDINIIENKEFNYTIFRKSSAKKSDETIFLFHGLNEKYWHKYLPWAEKLVELTGKTVLLFPIAFHMNRAPAEWSDLRLMSNISRLRKEHSSAITNSTFANSAISARTQMIPQRFFWSGLQTFNDIADLIKDIREDKHPLISANSKIDLFSYSVGSFLSEILIMANPLNYFDDTKLFMFCGGPVLDRMSPNSKFILDSDATIAIYSYYTERLESELKIDKRIAHYFNGDHPSGNYFKAMLSYNKNKVVRGNRFRELSNKIKAVALIKDEVIPPNEVLNTLKGDFRDIPIKVEVKDFPFQYNHINTFPLLENIEELVTEEFNNIFNCAAEFFCG